MEINPFWQTKSETATTMEAPLWLEECVKGVWLAKKHQRGFHKGPLAGQRQDEGEDFKEV